MTETTNRIAETGQAGFLLALTVCSVFFAIGFSITVFGLTTTYLVTSIDKIIVIAIGIGLIAVGTGGTYRMLTT